MEKRQKAFEEAKRELDKILRTLYACKIVMARHALQAIEGTSIEDQQRLFAILIGQAYTLRTTETNNSVTGGDKEQFCEMTTEFGPDFAKLIGDALSDNRSLKETATKIWDRLTLVEAGFRREVALSGLLQPMNGLVPYAPLPRQPTILPVDIYPRIHEDSLDKTAILFRIIREPGLTPIARAAMVEALLQDCTVPQRVNLLGILLQPRSMGG